jgi:peptide/nickel transport system permease protein
MGRTLSTDRSIVEVLGPRIKNTLILAALALLFYIPLTFCPAILQATRRDSWLDHLLSLITLVFYSIPDFLLGTLLLLLFVVVIPWLPATSIIDELSTFSEVLRALILPAATLAIVMAAYATRMLRDNLVEILDADFIKFVSLNGISRRRIIWRHALPNALVPTLNVTALNLAYLIGGVVVVEKVFSYPGFGSLLLDALLLRDVPLIQVTVLIAAATYIGANLIADLGAIFLNPRLRS